MKLGNEYLKDLVNADKAFKMEDKLNEIIPEETFNKIWGWGNDNGRLTHICTFIPVKGNKEVINKAKNLGFVVGKKTKTYDGTSYIVGLTYNFHYDKYAIFQKKHCGLFAILYIDKYEDLKRSGFSYISPDELPVTVNGRGGYCPYDGTYDTAKGTCLYIKTVKEWEEPLTREERFPKNNESFYYGWISPAGDTYACEYYEHMECAKAICEELGLNSYHPEETLEELGWMKVSRPSDVNKNKVDRWLYFGSFERYITDKQVAAVEALDMTLEKNSYYVYGED